MNDQRLLGLLSKIDRGHARIRLARADYEMKLNRRLATSEAVPLFAVLNSEIAWLRADFDVKRANFRVKDSDLEYRLLKSRVEALETGQEDLPSYAAGVLEVRKLQHQVAVELAENAHPFARIVTDKEQRARNMLGSGAISYEEYQAFDLAAKEAQGLARLADQSVIDTSRFVEEAETDLREVRRESGS